VLVNGPGNVNANPATNAYPTNQSITLTAVPNTGEHFFSWSGDATGTQNPLTISLTQSKVITANFALRPVLRTGTPGLEGLTPSGFRFSILSDPQLAWQVFVSTNLSTWDSLGTVTNTSGQTLFTDPAALGLKTRFYKVAPWP
jgi:hypothetical protein